jgi:hypothetical protein
LTSWPTSQSPLTSWSSSGESGKPWGMGSGPNSLGFIARHRHGCCAEDHPAGEHATGDAGTPRRHQHPGRVLPWEVIPREDPRPIGYRRMEAWRLK